MMGDVEFDMTASACDDVLKGVTSSYEEGSPSDGEDEYKKAAHI